MEYLIQQSVMTIRERFHEPLSLDDLARSAMISKYYFLRLFTRVTGVTPGRFLSAVRLHEAKRLLVTTSLNVADISAQVGYSSTGTFSRRFSESVGVSPTQYRRLRSEADALPGEPVQPGQAADVPAAGLCSLTGTISAAEPPTAPAYVGLFDSPILQGRPVATAFAKDEFQLDDIPPGTWYVHAVAHSEAVPSPEPPVLVGVAGPLHLAAGGRGRAEVTLVPYDWTSPPILSVFQTVEGCAQQPCAQEAAMTST